MTEAKISGTGGVIVAPGGCGILDDFGNRVLGSSWGTPSGFVPFGARWSTSTSPGSTASVSGGEGHLIAPTTSDIAEALIDPFLIIPWTVEFDFRVDGSTNSSEQTLVQVGGSAPPYLVFAFVEPAPDLGVGTQVSMLYTQTNAYSNPGGVPTFYGHRSIGPLMAGHSGHMKLSGTNTTARAEWLLSSGSSGALSEPWRQQFGNTASPDPAEHYNNLPMVLADCWSFDVLHFGTIGGGLHVDNICVTDGAIECNLPFAHYGGQALKVIPGHGAVRASD